MPKMVVDSPKTWFFGPRAEFNIITESRHRGGKRRKRFEHDDGSYDHRQKRSGKRFHRKKTPKDGIWPDDDPRSSPRRR